jgi:polysaccharide chain length determinant protein (PEP-CTERM system associated)
MHENPNMAKNIADTIANTYVDNTLRWRQDATISSTSFIKQELETYRQRLREAEDALLTSQEKGVLDSLSSQDNTLIAELAKLRTDLVEVELDLQEANSELQSARNLPTGSTTSSSYYTSPEIIRLQADLAGLQARYTELSMTYTDEYPEVRKLKGEILRTKDELDQAKAKFGGSQESVEARIKYWEDKVRSLGMKRTALNDKISEYNRALLSLPQRQLELSRLRRDKAAAESTYSMLLQRLNESELLRSSELQNMGRVAQVLDPAILPDRPVKPNKKKIAFLAVAMGMAIGFGVTFLLEYFDRSFRSVDEVRSYLDIPVLAAIPKLNTPESEVKERKLRLVKVVCIASACLMALLLVVDIVSAELLARDPLFLSIARRGLGILRGWV